MPTARRVRLIVLCGIPGSGKTTIALAIGARLERCVHIETDVVRGMIAKPLYASGESRFVYQTAVSVAAEALTHKYDAVLVATFAREEFRREAISKLGNLCDTWLMVWAWCDPLLAYQRSSQRNSRIRREDFMRLWRTYEPPRDALVIDTRATSPEEAARKILTALGENLD
ncbi:MAG: AAA family ATPase [Thaumarchaeota archaeon]|nr:AAA family ATPase [Nitrososphaerota archaeon]